MECAGCFDYDDGSPFSWQLVGSGWCRRGSHCSSRSSRAESLRSQRPPSKEANEDDVGLFRWDRSGGGMSGDGDGGDIPSLAGSRYGLGERFTPELGSEDSYPFSTPSSSVGVQVATTDFPSTGPHEVYGRSNSCSSGTPTDSVSSPFDTPDKQDEGGIASQSIQRRENPPVSPLRAPPIHPLESDSAQRIPRKRRYSAPSRLEPRACLELEWGIPVPTAMQRDDRQRVGQLALWRIKCESYLPKLKVGVPLHIVVDGELYVPRIWEADEAKREEVVVARERGTVLEPRTEPPPGSDSKPGTKAKAESTPEPKPKSNWKAKRRAKLKLKQERELKLKLEQELVSKLEREREQGAKLTLQADPEPGPGPEPELKSKPAPVLASVPEPMPALIVEVEYESAPHPVSDQEPAPEPESAPQLQPLILIAIPTVYHPQPSVLDGRNPSYRLISKGRKALRKKMGLPQWRRSGERPETGFMSRPMLLTRTEWLGIPVFGNWYVADGMGGGVCWSYDLTDALRRWREA